jgi:hypothetical protein
MDLKEFVSRTLSELHAGVADAQKRHKESGEKGAIGVLFRKGEQVDFRSGIRDVEFEVAITISEKTSATGRAGLRIATIADLGGDASRNAEKGSVNKIKFCIPMLFPSTIFDENEKFL